MFNESGKNLIPKNLSFDGLDVPSKFNNDDILIGTTIERLTQSKDGRYILYSYNYLCNNDASISILNKVRFDSSLTELPDMYRKG